MHFIQHAPLSIFLLNSITFFIITFYTSRIASLCTLCEFCVSDPFYIVTYYIKWVTTSWIASTTLVSYILSYSGVCSTRWNTGGPTAQILTFFLSVSRDKSEFYQRILNFTVFLLLRPDSLSLTFVLGAFSRTYKWEKCQKSPPLWNLSLNCHISKWIDFFSC